MLKYKIIFCICLIFTLLLKPFPLIAQCNTVEVYGNNIFLITEATTSVIKQDWTYQEFNNIMNEVGLYFGTALLHQNVALWRPGYIEINLGLLQELKQYKIELDQQINDIVSSFYEGNDFYKLKQISDYIATKLTYSYDLQYIEPLNALKFNKGSCMSYSILFYKMANVIGISTNMIIDEIEGGRHAWNYININQTKYYYDITWYDSPILFNYKYIQSTTNWHNS